MALASGHGSDYLSWAIFSGLVITGISIILHSFRFWHIGSGRLVVTNFNVSIPGGHHSGAGYGRAWATGKPGDGFHRSATSDNDAARVVSEAVHADGERNDHHAGGGLGSAVHR